MTKRKRSGENDTSTSNKQPKIYRNESPIHIQIVTGSYERALHGITVVVPKSILSSGEDIEKEENAVRFTDSFLFNAHTSAIRCLALAPFERKSPKVVLATGSTDERINLYHLSTRPPSKKTSIPSLKHKTSEDARNRILGVLHTHDATITTLHFPTKSKLISSCTKNIMAITSTRDWTTLSMLKAPHPRHPNRPTGDTSTISTLPNGISDFAVHPSTKLMISVGRAERVMRLWNLVTGKKAGVLGFSKEMLKDIGESTSRWGSGEGRKVIWNVRGTEFTIGFEWGACVFGEDSEPKGKILPPKKTRIHQLSYLSGIDQDILVVSTEDGKLLFYDTNSVAETTENTQSESGIPSCLLKGQLGGATLGLASRIKDFIILEHSNTTPYIVITAGSDGNIRIWSLRKEEITSNVTGKEKQVGRLLGLYETGNRITCLTGFIMIEDNEVEGRTVDVHEENDEDDEEIGKVSEDSEDSENSVESLDSAESVESEGGESE